VAAGSAIVAAVAGKAISEQIPFVSLYFLLIDQLTELSNLIIEWLSTIATLTF
jgi:hypothetical protein